VSARGAGSVTEEAEDRLLGEAVEESRGGLGRVLEAELGEALGTAPSAQAPHANLY
jgi:hypothetical protein